MRFRSPLLVQINRNEHTRNLTAYAIQVAADGRVYGKNILARCSVRRIETAKLRVVTKLGLDPGSLTFEVKASGDYVRSAQRDDKRTL